jgi:hypothetical protein
MILHDLGISKNDSKMTAKGTVGAPTFPFFAEICRLGQEKHASALTATYSDIGYQT